MMMMIKKLTDSLVRRNLKRTGRYVEAEAGAPSPVHPPLDADETLIGWYVNPPPYESVKIFFTTKAIIVVGPDAAEARRLAIQEITAWRPAGQKEDTTGVNVEVGGQSHFIRCAGRYGPGGKFSDAYSLGAILHVIVSLRQSSPGAE
jgi:hypothetical protein